MKIRVSVVVLACMLGLTFVAAAQNAKPKGVLTAAELKKLVPRDYFFAGQTAPVQLRNSGGIRFSDGKLLLTALVDTSGYSADIKQKYQGLFITEAQITIEGKNLPPGEYGFGRTADGNFNILDVASDTVASFAGHADDSVKRPVPLQMTAQGGDSYRLYLGKNYVQFSLAK